MNLKTAAKETLLASAEWLGVNSILRRKWRQHLLVLCYHGVVTDDHPEDSYRTRSAVSLNEFRWQLEFIGKHYNPVSVGEVQHAVYEDRRLPPKSLLITFDDGLRNNLTVAAAELENRGYPAVFFVPTGHIGGQKLLWTHELDERILSCKTRHLPSPDGASDIRMPVSMSARIPIADRIRNLCKEMPDQQRREYLELLREMPLPLLAGWTQELYGFLSWDEVRELDRRGFDIGAHTVSHPILTRLSSVDLDQELRESKATIELQLGHPCPWIAYPNGARSDYSTSIISAVGNAGYQLGFTLMGCLNETLNPFEIHRVCVTGQLPENTFRAKVGGLVMAKAMAVNRS